MPFVPQRGPQAAFIEARWCQEILFAGGRFSGKSQAQLGYQEDAALSYGGKSRGVMFRKTYGELEELQIGAREIFGGSGAVFKSAASADYPVANAWYFRNGATVKMMYIENARDYGRVHGFQFSHISVDELGEYLDPSGVYKLMSTLRSSHGVPCSIRFTANPGGAGHSFIKRRYIDFSAPCIPTADPDSGIERMWIPATMRDNTIGMTNNPNYENVIRSSAGGNEALMRAWLNGEWDIIAGSFYPEFERAKHVIKPFNIPKDWVRIVGFDWGSSSPFAVLWAAVSNGDHGIPAGALVIYREWYGAKEDHSGNWVGLKMVAEEIADGIKERELGEKIDHRVADPSAFKEDGGPSHMERMGLRGVHFCKADNSRISGWDSLRSRLQWQNAEGTEDFPPMIYFFDTCQHLIRTLPIMQHDPHKIEDLDKCSDDHAVDSLRYLSLARPWIRDEHKPKDPIGDILKPKTFNDYLKIAKRERRSRED